MPVVNTKSTFITNADATPVVLNQDWIARGMLVEAVATVEVAAGDDDGSVFRMVRLPAGARVTSVEVACDAITGGISFDVGIYRTAADGGAVVDADLFASAVDLSSALSYTDVTWEANVANGKANVEKRLWELAPGPLTADPQTMYDIALTGNTVGTAAGTITMRVRWVL
jgi:hypothetical protein